MADTTISAAASLTASTVADGDLIPVLDISASAGSKASKITVAEMKARVLAAFPSDGHPYGFKDGAVVRLKDSSISPFATNVSSVAGWTVMGDTPLLVGTDVRFANPGNVTDISLADSFDAGAVLDFSALTGLLTIGAHAFDGQDNLTGDLTLPDSLTTIGGYAFDICTGFTGNLTIGSSVTTIGVYAFNYCTGFTGNLTIGSSVTSIGGSAFYGCGGFTGTLTIPSSVTTIGSGAFGNCSGFTGTLTIPNSVTYIEPGVDFGFFKLGVFIGCTGLTRVDAYVESSVLDVTCSLYNTSVTDIHVPASGAVSDTWTAGGGQTIGGQTGITVTKDL